MGEAWERIVPPTESAFLKQRVGYRVGQGVHSQLFHKQCGGGCRLRYTYFSNLVARMRLPVSIVSSFQLGQLNELMISLVSCPLDTTSEQVVTLLQKLLSHWLRAERGVSSKTCKLYFSPPFSLTLQIN